ncbi:brain-enriched guanylate kinase-associated protein isoform X1 [Arapaima gigas]
MVQLELWAVSDRTSSSPKMLYGSPRVDRRVAATNNNGTLPWQPKVKVVPSWQERASRSSTASCPKLPEQWQDPDKELPQGPPSGLSSPSRRSSVDSLQSSSSSLQNSSPGVNTASSSEDSSCDTNSWSSGATCLLRSTIKKHSEEVFRARLGSGSRAEGTNGTKSGCPVEESGTGSCTWTERQEETERGLGRRDSAQSLSSSQDTTTMLAQLEQKIEAKLKFSQFLDEVTCRVLDPNSLQAFGAIQRRELPSKCSSTLNSTANGEPWRRNMVHSIYQWNKCLPSCKVLDASEATKAQEEPNVQNTTNKAYLETDIDSVRREDQLEVNSPHKPRKATCMERDGDRERERRPTPVHAEPSHERYEGLKSATSVFSWNHGLSRSNNRSTSLPRSSSSTTSVGEMQNVRIYTDRQPLSIATDKT